jgi:hypothetical protein
MTLDGWFEKRRKGMVGSYMPERQSRRRRKGKKKKP